jgi:hypothetical protein
MTYLSNDLATSVLQSLCAVALSELSANVDSSRMQARRILQEG